MARECPTGKKSFKNQGDATNYMRELKRRNPATVNVRNVYPCEHCGNWHMTSQARHGYRLAMGKRMRYIEMDDIQRAAFEVRSSQVADPSTLRAPTTRVEGTNRIIRSSPLRSRGPLHASSDREAAPGAQNSTSAR